jgi:predicted transcriptional regulator
VITTTISPENTAADALREMQELNVGALLVTDQERRVLGMVEREELLSRLLLSLIR